MDMYRTLILEQSKHPHNKGTLKSPDIRYKEKNPLCGDEIQIDVQLTKGGNIKDVKFDGHGCAISQAAASLLTEEVKVTGTNVDDILALKRKEMLDLLGIELTAMRMKCGMLALHVMQKGILQYKAKNLNKQKRNVR